MTGPADRSPRKAGSSWLARLVSPFVAVVPWLLTMAGLAVANRWLVDLQRAMEVSWGHIIGGTALLIVAALVWAALTAWSSVGTFVAGACTILFGVVLSVPDLFFRVSQAVSDAPGLDLGIAFDTLSPPRFLLFGSLLVAAALGAAGARRRGR